MTETIATAAHLPRRLAADLSAPATTVALTWRLATVLTATTIPTAMVPAPEPAAVIESSPGRDVALIVTLPLAECTVVPASDAVAATGPSAKARDFDGTAKHGPQSYTLLTGFEDTEMPETEQPTSAALSATQYGDLR